MSITTREALQKMNDAKAELRKVLDATGGAPLSGDAEKRADELGRAIDGYAKEAEYRAMLDDAERAQAKAHENRAEFKRFSLARAIMSRIDGGKTDAGFEDECQQELEHRGMKRRGDEILVPRSYFEHETRAVTTANTGANLVPTDFLASQYVDALRAQNPLTPLGATYLSGLSSPVDIPASASLTSVGWLASDGSDFTTTDKTFAKISMAPCTVGSISSVSLGILSQAGMAVDKLLADDMSKALGLEIAKQAIAGDGTSGKPLGLLAASRSIPDVQTPAAVVGYATAVRQALMNSNVDISKIGYLINSNKLTVIEGVVTTDGLPVPVETILRGRPYAYTDQVTATQVLCAGDYSELVIGEFGEGVRVDFNPYSKFASGGLDIRCMAQVGVAVRHSAAFVTLGAAGE